METVYVIGSGPSGIACALGLLESKNVRVVMLDVGKELDPNILKQRIDDNIIKRFPDKQPPWENPTSKKFVKHLFGSIFPYEIDDIDQCIQLNNSMLRASFAKGGLSNIWGASIMNYRREDMLDWPLTADEMVPFYKKILDHLPLSTCKQEDFHSWPILHNSPSEYYLSEQALYLLNYYKKNKSNLNKNGILAGGARLAMYQKQTHTPKGCIYCGECMYGCAKDSVYSTKHTFSILEKNPLFKYHSGIRIEKISENENEVMLDGIELKTNHKIRFNGSKVFLATGVLMSSHLLMNSFDWLKNIELKIQDSQHFILPCIMLKRIKDIKSKSTHALCQLYYEIVNPKILAESIHLQLYTYMDLFTQQFKNKFNKLTWLLNPLIDRMLVIQGYLPSSVSSFMSVKFDSNENKLKINGHSSEKSKFILKQLKNLLFKNTNRLGFIPLTMLFEMSKIGAGNHYGGTFPMKKNPLNFKESDLLGRPKGLNRVHVVDASVLPSIPAQSLTLAAMANAYRIGLTA